MTRELNALCAHPAFQFLDPGFDKLFTQLPIFTKLLQLPGHQADHRVQGGGGRTVGHRRDIDQPVSARKERETHARFPTVGAVDHMNVRRRMISRAHERFGIGCYQSR